MDLENDQELNKIFINNLQKRYTHGRSDRYELQKRKTPH